MLSVLIHTDTRYPVNRKVIRQAVADVFAANNINPSTSGGEMLRSLSLDELGTAGLKLNDTDAEVSVSVVGERKMKAISLQYLGDGKKHGILSFSFEEAAGGFVNPPDGILRLGDIILCWGEVLLAAIRDDVLVDEELYLLTSHGVLHLLGKHHE